MLKILNGVQFPAVTFRMALRPIQPPIHCILWILGALSWEAKWLGCEANHSQI